MSSQRAWPELKVADWRDTRDTLRLWSQVVGKVRLALSPPVNHWWHVPLYVSIRSLTTSPMPYRDRHVEIELDFYDAVRAAADPDAALLSFLRSTYAAAADLAGWNRAALGRPPQSPPSSVAVPPPVGNT